MIGQILRGYEILEEIARGGQGAIYLAHEQSVDRNVAIKVILPHYADKPEFKQRFEGEARLVARLEHPHIVPLYSYWQDDNGAFLVMRLIKGGSLRNLMDTQGALSLSHIKRILSHLTDALAFAHRNSVVHRDLKPENILLDDLGNSYLTDFGIAKQINQPSNLTATDGIMGSWKYLSPEQIQSSPVTPQTDIYALGVMLYEMLAGEHPFKDDAATMLIMRHLQDALPDIRDKRPDLPDALDNVIQTATAKEQAQRYADVPAFLEAFEQAITLPVTASAPQLLTPTAQSKHTTIEERNREAMLQNVRAFWVEGVLEQSLYKAVRIELGMSEATEAVDNPWQTVLKMPQSSDETLPKGTTILNIFERLQGKLLILGEPGSGKTTTLLELTRDLLNRAEVDNAHPLPVVFNLSSWAENRKSLAEWMVDELNTKYQVPRKIGTVWVEAEQILPLLDGLDEVASDHRNACVEMINTYRREHGFVDVVVCSRIIDYEALTNKLRLNGAIVLQPLQREQVDKYLEQMGHELDAVRQVLEDDEKLRQLTTSPLMLNILILAYRGVDIADIPMFDSLSGRRKHLFETYVNRTLERRGKVTAYLPEKTKSYLHYLAKQLSNHALSVLYIETMQPDWLQGFKQRTAYIIGLPLLTVLSFISISYLMLVYLASIIGFFALFSTNSNISRIALIVSVLISLLIYIPFYNKHHRRSFNWSKQHWIVIGINLYLIIYSSITTIVGKMSVSGQTTSFHFLQVPLVFAGMGLFASIGYLLKRKIQPVDGVRWSWQQAFKGALFSGVVLASFPLLILLLVILSDLLIKNLLRRANPFVVTGSELLFWINDVIVFFVFGGWVGLFFNGIQNIVIKYRKQPNQGIWSSTQRSALIMVIWAFILAVLTSPAYGFSTGADAEIGIVTIMNSIILFMIPFFALIGGGYAAIQHVILRTVMWLSGLLPLNLAHFLDSASDNLLLRKVGGGYIFIHRLLLDYFANLDDKYDGSERIDRLSDSTNDGYDSDISDTDESDNQDIMQN